MLYPFLPFDNPSILEARSLYIPAYNFRFQRFYGFHKQGLDRRNIRLIGRRLQSPDILHRLCPLKKLCGSGIRMGGQPFADDIKFKGMKYFLVHGSVLFPYSLIDFLIIRAVTLKQQAFDLLPEEIIFEVRGDKR